MLKAGLTGGIATGKSTVAKLFHAKGAVIVDFDLLAHEAQAPGTDTYKRVLRLFGDGILGTDGEIDRARLGTLVFADRQKLAQLNTVVHPAVFDRWRLQTESVEKRNRHSIVVADIPLLIETGCKHLFDTIILVYAPPSLQIERLKKRNGLSRREAELRLSAQMSIDEKRTHADFIIDNGGSLDDTIQAVDDVWKALTAMEYNLRLKKEENS